MFLSHFSVFLRALCDCQYLLIISNNRTLLPQSQFWGFEYKHVKDKRMQRIEKGLERYKVDKILKKKRNAMKEEEIREKSC